MEGFSGIYLFPVIIIDDKKKIDYVGMTTGKFKEH